MAPADKASLLGTQFYNKQCHEQFVTHSSCFPKSMCNSLVFRTPVILRLLLDFDTYGGVDPLGVFPLFLKMVADITAPKLITIFRGYSVRDHFRSVVGPLMKLPFISVLHPLIRKTTISYQ